MLKPAWVLRPSSQARQPWRMCSDDVKKRGELVIGMEAQYVPYALFKDGQIVGYDVDILNKFAGEARRQGQASSDTGVERHPPGAAGRRSSTPSRRA